MAAKRRPSRHPTRTKIVATLGPASATPVRIRELIRAGVDVFRINFSHGKSTEHQQAIRRVRVASKRLRRPVAILADLQGPKIRVGELADAPLVLKRGQPLVIVAGDIAGGPGRIGCTYAGLAKDVRKGDPILLDDGGLELRVTSVRGKEVRTKVVHGGPLLPNKGINLPGSAVRAPSLGPKDLFDLDVALTSGVDYVALSFVRTAKEVLDLKRRIASFGSDAEVIAKIERPEAVANIEAIVEATDGVMVARGDMGVELGAEAVPGHQKRIIRQCVTAAKPVITATQVLESMIEHPRPTRAEASDVANAIYDGTSALMLSGETAVGSHPITTVKTMTRIARQTEAEIFASSRRHPTQRADDLRRLDAAAGLSIVEASVSAAARAALESDARAVCVFTETSRTAKLVARERLPTRLIAFTPAYRTYLKLALQWGIIPLLAKRARTLDQMLAAAEDQLVERGHARAGDRVVFIAGTVQVSGATNTVTIREVGGA